METLFRLMAVLGAVLTIVMTGLMLLRFRRERPIKAGFLLLSIGLSLAVPLLLMAVGGARLRPVVALPLLVLGLLVGLVRGTLTKLQFKGDVVVGTHSALFLLGWGGSLALAQLLNLFGSTLLASAGLMSVWLSTGTQVGINTNLLVRRLAVRRSTPSG